MPKLTVRSLAEMLQLPAYEQLRILHEQKYPKDGDSPFKIPYYSPALTTIRRFYRGSNDPLIITDGRIKIDQSVGLDVRRRHNKRVIDSFQNGRQATRALRLLPNRKFLTSYGQVQVRLHFDLSVNEAGIEKFIFYNFRNSPITPQMAKETIEVAAMVLRDVNVTFPTKNIEFIDLFSGQVFTAKQITKRTETNVQRNIQLIETMWRSI